MATCKTGSEKFLIFKEFAPVASWHLYNDERLSCEFTDTKNSLEYVCRITAGTTAVMSREFLITAAATFTSFVSGNLRMRAHTHKNVHACAHSHTYTRTHIYLYSIYLYIDTGGAVCSNLVVVFASRSLFTAPFFSFTRSCLDPSYWTHRFSSRLPQFDD